MTILLGPSLLLMGIVAGIYASVLIHDHRISDLLASQYAALHQMRDKSFGKVMPVLGLTNLALVLACTLLVFEDQAMWLGAGAVALLMLDIALTVWLQLPLNRAIQGWAATSIPADWTAARDRWTAQHNIRAALGIGAYACLIAATLLDI